MKIEKIKLINWHIFSNTVFPLSNNSLITGDNGSGKSTLIDAIYYLLSGGDDKSFNKASGQGGFRTLETYMRCKVGNQNETYVRSSSDVISYIIAELKDNNNERHVLGVCLEIVSYTRPKPNFFFIPNKIIKDDDYLDGNKILSYQDFKQRVKNYPGFADYSNKPKRDISRTIASSIFHIKDHRRFNKLLQNAISFNPIKEVSSFVNDFLLEEERVDLDSLIQQIREYRDLKNMIIREEDKINHLNTFIDDIIKYQANVELNSYLSVVGNEKYVNDFSKNLEHDNNEIIKLNDLINENHLNIKNIDNEILEYNSYKHDIENNEQFKALNQFKIKLNELKIALKNRSYELNELIDNVSIINDLGKKFEYNNDLNKYIKNKDYSQLKIHLDELYNYLIDCKDKYGYEIHDLDKEKIEKSKEKSNKENELNNLKQGINNYDYRINTLKNILINKIKETYPSDEVYINPFCEYVEVIDDEWNNALEGYLGKQRFNLIVDPKYFDIAIKEYERIKDQLNIYGVGLVNIASIKDSEVLDNSLFNKVVIENKFASIYAKKLLGKVIFVDSILDIKKYESSITRDVMIYKNNVLKACNPEIYKKPYLGIKSRQRRIDLLIEEINELNINIKKIIEEISYLNSRKNLLNGLERIALKENLWSIIDNINLNINETNKEIVELEKDESLMSYSIKINEYQQKIYDLKKYRESLLYKNNEYNQKIGTLDSKINDYKIKIDDFNKQIQDRINLLDQDKLNDYRNKYSSYSAFDISKKINEAKKYNENKQNNIQRGITHYSQNYNSALISTLDNLNDYINEYHRLQNQDIPQFKEKANNAYLVAKSSFRKDFIAKLKQKIDNARTTFKNLNNKLKLHKFGTEGEVFSFIYEPSKNEEFREYYRIITSGKNIDITSLFDEAMSPKDEEIMKRLFDKLSGDKNDKNSEKMIEMLLDYRNYMNYDIEIMDRKGKISLFSEINREKSGGETQTPFYIVMAACFEELMTKSDSSCCIILDEAFNNMDEERIKSMMEFYKELNIQVIIVVPTIRVNALLPYCDLTLGIAKDSNKGFIYQIARNER